MNELETLRDRSDSWGTVSFLASESDDRGTFDGNQTRRHRVLLALQHDRRDTDIELIRHLFVHELIAAENDSFQGLDDSLKLAAFLLARFRDPADIPLFARAKLANFDTWCGFPLEFLFVAYGTETDQQLKANNPELWSQFVSDFGDLSVEPDELSEWWEWMNDEYPDAPEDEHVLALYERALVFDDHGLARQYLEQWADAEPESASKQSRLKYEYARLNDFKESAKVAGEILKQSESRWDQASALRDLVELHRKAGEFTLSLQAAQQLNTTLSAFDDWIGVGLGRMAIHETFELACAHPETADARTAFSLADGWFQRSRNLALVGLESAAKAAERCGFAEKASEYQQLAATERKRIDEMLA